MKLILKKSNRKNKKYEIVMNNHSHHFGDDRYEDYTIHKDAKRKARYIARHKKREDWNEINTAGFWAKNLLWNKKTLSASIKDVEKRYGLKIVNKI